MIRATLSQRVQQAMQLAGIPADLPPSVAPSNRPQFGDYQANGVLAAAKAMGRNPRELAAEVVLHLDLNGIADQVEIAGPGFINIHLSHEWLSAGMNAMQLDPYFGVSVAAIPQTIVVDYSSPNLAKEMHVGHLRSTIIGDAVAKTLEFLGHRVIRQNHMGDWGTQFGMLIAELDAHLQEGQEPSMALRDLEAFYRQSKQHFDADPEFANRARDYVVRLQSGDEACLALWRRFIAISIAHSEEIYRALKVTLTSADIRPESAYNEALPKVVSDLEALGLITEDQNTKLVFLTELADKEGTPSPVIIQKKDGGYLYATTDLAALRYRVDELKADRILYFIDARQSLHMKQVFTVARKANWVSESIQLEHCAFGTMMGADGKPFKTRSGDTVKLADLIEEAVERAAIILSEKTHDFTPEEFAEVSQKVGIGAVKYGDLCKTRTNDYLFDWNTLLAFEGNTGPYLQYAYARIRSLFRKAEVDWCASPAAIRIQAEAEKKLAIKLSQFAEVVEQVGERAYPHELCTYLYELAVLFMAFYEQCPILKEGIDEATKASRLSLSHLTAEVLQTGLALLGIETLDRM